MSGRMLLPASSTSTCTLLCTQDILLAKTPKNKSNQLADSGATGAAAIAFAADAKDEFVDFAWLDEDGTDPAGEEDAQALDDLLRLESVFGNAEVNSTAGSSDLGSSDLGISDLGSSVGVGDDLRDEEAACCVEDLLEGDDAEGLLRLFDGDLQDALLALPDGELDSCSDKGKDGPCFGTSAFNKTADCGGHDTTTDHTSVDCCDTSFDGSVSESSVTSPEKKTAAPLPPANCGAQDTPACLRGDGTDIAVGFNAADAAGIDLVEVARPSDSGSGSDPGERDQEDDGRVSPETAAPTDKVVAPAGPASTAAAAPAAASAAPADTVAAAGVPTRLLDAIDLWESANAHATTRKKAAARAARKRDETAAAAKGVCGHRGAVTTRSKAKKIGEASENADTSGPDITKKKKNEFGKRRRSSGGGGATVPVLDPAAVAAATPARTKGKGKGKKVDPLVAVRDARLLSRKPLIVQWLKSDGCDSDAEAEAALGKAVGSLSAISRYWGGGG